MLWLFVPVFSGKCEVEVSPCQMNETSKPGGEVGFQLSSCSVTFFFFFLPANMGRFVLSRLTDVSPMLWIILLLLHISLRVRDLGQETRHLHILGS